MTREETRDYINRQPDIHLQRARKDVQGKPSYICPLCGNGSGADGDGLTTKDGTHWHCFKCGFHGDMIELIAQEYGLENGGSREAFDTARAVYGITLDDDTQHTYNTTYTPTAHNTQDVRTPKTEDDFKAYIDAHTGKGTDLSYLQARGISEETALALRFGYDADDKTIVIPIKTIYGKEYYIKRYTTERKDKDGNIIRYHVPKGGTNSGIFNEQALREIPPRIASRGYAPIFICEGAINAASIIEVGGRAIAINSTANARSFVDALSRDAYRCERYVVCMDNDAAGKAATDILVNGLKELEKDFIVFQHAEGCNDVNDALTRDRDAFKAAVNHAIKSFERELVAEVENHRASAMLDGFWNYVKDEKNNKPIPTGFEQFDVAIGGGLLPKFYIIGAISSLGKTTFVLQIADYIAAHGTDVLLFSLEMSKEDIIARSISRHTYEIESKAGGDVKRAKTELGITVASRYKNYSKAEADLIRTAFAQYKSYANNISIHEGKHTADDIRGIVERYISFTGKIPVVVVDYLQILQPVQSLIRATAKEQTDYNIDVFAAMRRELKTPIIGISAFNRSSYTVVADNSSFKESGNIEYSGDSIITLELDYDRATRGTDATNRNKEKIVEAMRKEPREIKLTFQKNRGNKVGTTLYYLYHAKFNHFAEDWTKEAEL